MGKTLVAYFSASGVTKKLAQTLADALSSAIKPTFVSSINTPFLILGKKE